MEKVYLIIEDGVVTGAQVWDDSELPDGVELVEHVNGMAAWIGWTHVDGVFTAPPPPPLPPVTELDPALVAAVLAHLQSLEGQGTP